MSKHRRITPQRAGTGVRGSVEYRRVSEQYVGQRNYPAALFALVNITLVLLAILLLFAAILAFTPLGKVLVPRGRAEEISLTLEFYDTSGALSAPALVGTALFDAARGEVIGEIVSISARPLSKDVILWQDAWESIPEDAGATPLTYPVQIVTVTVRATAQYREAEGYYTPWGDRLFVGGGYTVTLGGSLVTGRLTALSPLNEEVNL